MQYLKIFPYSVQVVKNVGQSARLDCEVTYDSRLEGETELVWTRNGTGLETKAEKYLLRAGSEKALEVRDLTLEDDGLYECEVRTPFEVVRARVALRVGGNRR